MALSCKLFERASSSNGKSVELEKAKLFNRTRSASSWIEDECLFQLKKRRKHPVTNRLALPFLRKAKLVEEVSRDSNRHTFREKVQYAFKDLMIHGILQFTLRIAFRCVLHRCESQEIRCQKFYLLVVLSRKRLQVNIKNRIQTKMV